MKVSEIDCFKAPIIALRISRSLSVTFSYSEKLKIRVLTFSDSFYFSLYSTAVDFESLEWAHPWLKTFCPSKTTLFCSYLRQLSSFSIWLTYYVAIVYAPICVAYCNETSYSTCLIKRINFWHNLNTFSKPIRLLWITRKSSGMIIRSICSM